MPRNDRPCRQAGCPFPAMERKQTCGWHWLLGQPLDVQIAKAKVRLEGAMSAPGYQYRPRIPKEQWPAGGRWCSGCQSFVPLFYTHGSRCNACGRLAARASHVERTYGLSGEEERALHGWQSGRCFICGRRMRTRGLAVDHDHVTGDVRGLLCSDNDFGCNVTLRRILGNPAAAQRLLAYVQRPPLQRMRDGEPPWRFADPPAGSDDGPPPF